MTRRSSSSTQDKPASYADRRLSPRAAADALAQGQLVVLPTDTVFGLAARATDPRTLDQLWATRGSTDAPRAALAWHMSDTATLISALGELSAGSIPPVHRRLADRLTPGPVMFAIPAQSDRLATLRARIGAAPGAIDDTKELLARVPSHPVTQEIIRSAQVPIIVAALPGTGPHPARGGLEAWAQLERHSGTENVAGFVADAPAPTGRPSTLIRLTPDSYEIVREGAYETRFINKRLARNLLFVCTGNTCRSPMAEAIARDLVARRGTAIPVAVRSAGVSAGSGSPATSEAVAAVRGIGVEMSRHSSTPLNREMLADADVIFTLTQGHRQSVIAMDPSAAARVLLLDPEGQDVPDPIGQPQDAYDRTARRIKELVEQRLTELNW